MPVQKRTRLTGGEIGLLGLAVAVGALSFDLNRLHGLDNTTGPSPSQIEKTAAPKSTLSLEDRADIFMARKSYADAVDYYYRALNQPALASIDGASICNKLGIAYQQQMNFGLARKAYKEAIRLRADFGEPWNNMGTTYYMENRFGKSVKCYSHAVKMNPDSPTFHINLGTSYYRMKKYKEAVEEYRTALTLDSNIFSEHAAGGTVMQTRGADADFYFYLAKSFALVGRADEAVRYLRRAFEDGFKDQKRLAEDPDIKKISQNPAYVELMKNPPIQ